MSEPKTDTTTQSLIAKLDGEKPNRDRPTVIDVVLSDIMKQSEDLHDAVLRALTDLGAEVRPGRPVVYRVSNRRMQELFSEMGHAVGRTTIEGWRKRCGKNQGHGEQA